MRSGIPKRARMARSTLVSMLLYSGSNCFSGRVTSPMKASAASCIRAGISKPRATRLTWMLCSANRVESPTLSGVTTYVGQAVCHVFDREFTRPGIEEIEQGAAVQHDRRTEGHVHC